MHGIKTSILELRNVISEYRIQLRRMRVEDVDKYPIIINIKNESNEDDGWEIDDHDSKDEPI